MERSWGARTTKRRLIPGIKKEFEGFARFPEGWKGAGAQGRRNGGEFLELGRISKVLRGSGGLKRSWCARTTKRKLIPRLREDFESFARLPRVGRELGRKSDETEADSSK